MVFKMSFLEGIEPTKENLPNILETFSKIREESIRYRKTKYGV